MRLIIKVGIKMQLEYNVIDKNGLTVKLWAYGEYTANGINKLNIRDKVINTVDLSLEPYTIKPTGNFKHDKGGSVIVEV